MREAAAPSISFGASCPISIRPSCASSLRSITCREYRIGKLSPREKEVLLWIKEGKTTSEISSNLSISERTVKFHVRNTLRKVRASTRAQAVAVSLEKGLIRYRLKAGHTRRPAADATALS